MNNNSSILFQNIDGANKSNFDSLALETKTYDNRFSTGCTKSHYTKVQAYCSACDHLICKISSGMFQKSSSFEEFNSFNEIDVHFF